MKNILMKSIVLQLVLVLSALSLTGCDQQPANGTTSQKLSYPYTIITTTGMINDITRQIAGEKANTKALIGEGVDPHLYTPTRNDVAALQGANIIFYNGLLLEGKMSDLFVRLATKGRPIYAVTESIDHQYLVEPDDGEGHHDPHVWMDVSAWTMAVNVITDKLSKFDQANAAYYKKNAEQYVGELKKLHDYAKQSIASIPKESRILITAHDAFNYLGKAYDIEVMGIQGLSTESKAGLQRINNLVDLIVKRKVKAVFVESSVSDKNVKSIIEGAKAAGHEVVIGGELYSDAMGKANTYPGTYVGMIDHNITTITKALGGQVPDKGLNGQLTHE